MVSKNALCFGLLLSLFLIAAGPATGGEAISTIRIVTPPWPTLTQEDGSGLYFDLMRKIYEPLGIEVEYDIVPWKRAKDRVRSGQADAMLATYLTPDDPDFVYPQHPMDMDRVMAVFKKGGLDWKGSDSLEGKTVVWKRGYNFQNYLDTEMNWTEIDSDDQAWKMVAADRTDVYLDIQPTIEAYRTAHPIDPDPFWIERAFVINTYPRFGDNQRARKFIDLFDQRMVELKKSGELDALFEKWSMEAPFWEPGPPG